jgi:opacity protein-like surface antigen
VNWTRIACLWVCAAASAAAHAQAQRAATNRPSERSPSSLLGRLGGDFTNSTTRVSNLGGDRRDFSGSGLGLSYGGGLGLGRGMDDRRASIQGAWASSTRGLGVSFGDSRRQPIPEAFRRASSGELAAVAYLDVALSMETPLLGWGFDRVNMPNSPYFGSRNELSTFQQTFGLTPATPVPAERPTTGPPPPRVTLGGLVGVANDQRLSEMQARGIEAFREGTTPGPDRESRLARAQSLLQTVRDLDSKSALAPLLLAHIAAERNHTDSAVLHLIEALNRDPQVIAKRAAASYFGDAATLERQMRALQRLGDQRDSLPTYLFQAYCAYMLGDVGRMNEALERADKLARDIGLSERGRLARFALGAAAGS